MAKHAKEFTILIERFEDYRHNRMMVISYTDNSFDDSIHFFSPTGEVNPFGYRIYEDAYNRIHCGKSTVIAELNSLGTYWSRDYEDIDGNVKQPKHMA